MVVGNLMSKSKLKYKEFNEFFKSSELKKVYMKTHRCSDLLVSKFDLKNLFRYFIKVIIGYKRVKI